MTQDEIIEMAREALKQEPREDWNSTAWVFADETLEAFAKLVEAKAAAKEREACAEIAEKQRYAMCISLTSHPVQNGTAVGIANEIRARGQA